MEPKERLDMSGSYELDEDLMEEMEGFETTAVLKEHGAFDSTSETGKMERLSPTEGFLDDIDSPTFTGVFEKKE